MWRCPTFLRTGSKAPSRQRPEFAATGAGQSRRFSASARNDQGAPHVLVLVDLPVGPVDLMAREEVGARGIDDEPEEERVSGGDVVIDARIRTADAAQVRPGIMVPSVLVDGGIPDRFVR